MNDNTRRLERVLDRDGRRCHICGLLMVRGGGLATSESLDHLIPAPNPQRNHLDHLRAAHRGCNSIRQHEPVTTELIRECRSYLIANYREELLWAGETYQSLTDALLEISEEARRKFVEFRMEQIHAVNEVLRSA